MTEDDDILAEIEAEGLPETALFDEVVVPEGAMAEGLDTDPDDA